MFVVLMGYTSGIAVNNLIEKTASAYLLNTSIAISSLKRKIFPLMTNRHIQYWGIGLTKYLSFFFIKFSEEEFIRSERMFF